MARAAIAVTSCVKNGVALQTETVRAGGLTGTDGLYIPATATPDDSMVLYIRETNNGATGSVYIKAGAGDIAINKGVGDLIVFVGGSACIQVGPLERARFGQADGTINVDIGGVTGLFTAIDVRN